MSRPVTSVTVSSLIPTSCFVLMVLACRLSVSAYPPSVKFFVAGYDGPSGHCGIAQSQAILGRIVEYNGVTLKSTMRCVSQYLINDRENNLVMRVGGDLQSRTSHASRYCTAYLRRYGT